MKLIRIFCQIGLFLVLLSLVTSCSDDTDTIRDTVTRTQEDSVIGLFADNRSGEGEDSSEGAEVVDSLEANCFTFVYPITIVLPDGSSQDITSAEEFDAFIDNWFEQNPDSEDVPMLRYPLSIEIDGVAQVMSSEEAFCEVISECIDDFYGDDDFEDYDDDYDGDYDEDYEDDYCFDFVFPITLILSDGVNVSINDYDALDSLYDSEVMEHDTLEIDLPEFLYPLTVTLTDSTTQVIEDDLQLDQLYIECYGDYDSDDDDDDDND